MRHRVILMPVPFEKYDNTAQRTFIFKFKLKLFDFFHENQVEY